MPCGNLPGPLGSGAGHEGQTSVHRTYPNHSPSHQLQNVIHGPIGANSDPNSSIPEPKKLTPRSITEDDKNELRLLQEVYKVSSPKKRPYTKRSKEEKSVDVVENYLQDRDEFFDTDYRQFKADAQKELDEVHTKKDGKTFTLRDLLDPDKKGRARFPKEKWMEAQTAFYCWVRKALMTLHPNASVPRIIMTGESDDLKRALAKVKATYHGSFNLKPGFNARVTKIHGTYVLGNLSHHATGTAVDVDDANNPQIPPKLWTAIETFTGKQLNFHTRQLKWKDGAKTLYDAMQVINKAFVTELSKEMIKAEKAAQAATAALPSGKASSKVDPLDRTIAGNEKLKAISKVEWEGGNGKAFVNAHSNGFISLDLALVEAFKDAGFKWGATFHEIDIMHFEL